MNDGTRLPAGALQRAMDHMNEDHRDSLLEMVRAFARGDWAEDAELVGIDADGLDIRATGAGRQEMARVAFDAPLTGADGLRDAVVALARRARQQVAG